MNDCPTYVIADLHGRFDLLCKALSAIDILSPRGGRFVVLGDFVDRGPQSRNIIDLLAAGPQSPGWEWIVLQGNHEAMMLEALDTPNQRTLGVWLQNGGDDTLLSYGYTVGEAILPLKVPAEHLAWLRGLPVHYEDDLRIFVHAGVPYDKPVTETSVDTMQWMLYPRGGAEQGAHCSGKHIVHGHHQSPQHPLLLPGRTNLDACAYHTGRLAIGVFSADAAAPLETIWVA